ncbi:hypothetical protein QBC35DRAFT_533320 [Podospora australis]|uniref:Uncharacterized protein n=1 Tax=Podospora australis TaxID=1536484 RepID=A0AAN6WRQ1_9PEZI|nr:hypothetical protein QBC35DRAFT_533320 [Podospora australis]
MASFSVRSFLKHSKRSKLTITYQPATDTIHVRNIHDMEGERPSWDRLRRAQAEWIQFAGFSTAEWELVLPQAGQWLAHLRAVGLCPPGLPESFPWVVFGRRATVQSLANIGADCFDAEIEILRPSVRSRLPQDLLEHQVASLTKRLRLVRSMVDDSSPEQLLFHPPRERVTEVNDGGGDIEDLSLPRDVDELVAFVSERANARIVTLAAVLWKLSWLRGLREPGSPLFMEDIARLALDSPWPQPNSVSGVVTPNEEWCGAVVANHPFLHPSATLVALNFYQFDRLREVAPMKFTREWKPSDTETNKVLAARRNGFVRKLMAKNGYLVKEIMRTKWRLDAWVGEAPEPGPLAAAVDRQLGPKDFARSLGELYLAENPVADESCSSSDNNGFVTPHSSSPVSPKDQPSPPLIRLDQRQLVNAMEATVALQQMSSQLPGRRPLPLPPLPAPPPTPLDSQRLFNDDLLAQVKTTEQRLLKEKEEAPPPTKNKASASEARKRVMEALVTPSPFLHDGDDDQNNSEQFDLRYATPAEVAEAYHNARRPGQPVQPVRAAIPSQRLPPMGTFAPPGVKYMDLSGLRPLYPPGLGHHPPGFRHPPGVAPDRTLPDVAVDSNVVSANAPSHNDVRGSIRTVTANDEDAANAKSFDDVMKIVHEISSEGQGANGGVFTSLPGLLQQPSASRHELLSPSDNPLLKNYRLLPFPPPPSEPEAQSASLLSPDDPASSHSAKHVSKGKELDVAIAGPSRTSASSSSPLPKLLEVAQSSVDAFHRPLDTNHEPAPEVPVHTPVRWKGKEKEALPVSAPGATSASATDQPPSYHGFQQQLDNLISNVNGRTTVRDERQESGIFPFPAPTASSSSATSPVQQLMPPPAPRPRHATLPRTAYTTPTRGPAVGTDVFGPPLNHPSPAPAAPDHDPYATESEGEQDAHNPNREEVLEDENELKELEAHREKLNILLAGPLAKRDRLAFAADYKATEEALHRKFDEVAKKIQAREAEEDKRQLQVKKTKQAAKKERRRMRKEAAAQGSQAAVKVVAADTSPASTVPATSLADGPVDSSDEAPVPSPFEISADAQVDVPVVAPASSTADDPVTSHADAAVASAAGAPITDRVDVSVDVPFEVSVDVPITSLADAPVPSPTDVTAAAPADVPVDGLAVTQAAADNETVTTVVATVSQPIQPATPEPTPTTAAAVEKAPSPKISKTNWKKRKEARRLQREQEAAKKRAEDESKAKKKAEDEARRIAKIRQQLENDKRRWAEEEKARETALLAEVAAQAQKEEDDKRRAAEEAEAKERAQAEAQLRKEEEERRAAEEAEASRTAAAEARVREAAEEAEAEARRVAVEKARMQKEEEERRAAEAEAHRQQKLNKEAERAEKLARVHAAALRPRCPVPGPVRRHPRAPVVQSPRGAIRAETEVLGSSVLRGSAAPFQMPGTASSGPSKARLKALSERAKEAETAFARLGDARRRFDARRTRHDSFLAELSFTTPPASSAAGPAAELVTCAPAPVAATAADGEYDSQLKSFVANELGEEDDWDPEARYNHKARGTGRSRSI